MIPSQRMFRIRPRVLAPVPPVGALRLLVSIFGVCALLGVARLVAAQPVATQSVAAQSELPDGFYRYPAVGGGRIVFSSEGDLWSVGLDGGTATRLTAADGEERFPRISPDGRWIAFTAQYDGNDDVYVMGLSGGEPRRLTFHPAADQAIGWTAEGRILFRSRRDHPHGDFRCYTIAPVGGLPRMIPLEPAAWISQEPGGARMALQKIGLEFHNWKRYQGGEAEEIYVGTLEPPSFTEIARFDGKDAFPMWHTDGRIYFVTDRWGRPNLASMLPDGSDLRPLTRFTDYDVRWPALATGSDAASGAGRIVYQHRMDVWCYDIASGRNEIVPIRLPSDRLQVRERFVDPQEFLRDFALSQDGERIVLEARGELFVARTKKQGLIRQVTSSSAVRNRAPAFSPDGTTIAAITEMDGEEQVVLHSADNSAPPRRIGLLPPGYYDAPTWSPDGRALAFSDMRLRLLVMNVADGRLTVVDSSAIGPIRQFEWSPDGRYLAYAATLDNLYNQVRIWDGRTQRVHPLSDNLFDSANPSWDPNGKRIYFLEARHFNPYLDRTEARFIINDAVVPVAVALTADGELPFALRSDTDPKRPDSESKAKTGPGGRPPGSAASKKPAEVDEAPPTVIIDPEGLAERVVEVPVPPANYVALRAVEGKLHLLAQENTGMMPRDAAGEDEDGGPLTLHTYDLEEEKLTTLAEDVTGFAVSGNNRVLVFRTKDGLTRVEAGAAEAPEGEKAADTRVRLDGWSLRVDPRQEWRQMLAEAWRLQRDFFYDRNMHGVDWTAVRTQYESLTPRISTRDDLNDLFGEMLGELSVGHAYYWGGDVRRGRTVSTGLLGADLDHDEATGFWRIRRIYRGDYPTAPQASPLARPDLRVRPGQWLVAIDGRPLAKGEDYLARLVGRADKETELSINDTPRLDGARRIIVKPLAGDGGVRYADWVRRTRAYVDSVSGGTIGYLHLYDMGGLGLQQFARDYPPQWKKRGFIIDDRWNHGGFVAPMIVAHLDRKLFSIGNARYGSGIYTTPDRAFSGHLLCLINRQGGSDCETLAQEFKDFGLGPVVGMRTWGGWIGINGDKALRDGGVTTQPEFGGWDPRGREWQIEGHGVDPDVVLDLDPTGFLDGRDEQLDYALKDLMEKIRREPRTFAPPPPIRPRPLRPGNR